jgi:ankyrin repeat protein
VATLLIAAGADVNARTNRGETPLMAVASTNNAKLARALLAAGADRAARDNAGDTALDHARMSESDDVYLEIAG